MIDIIQTIYYGYHSSLKLQYTSNIYSHKSQCKAVDHNIFSLSLISATHHNRSLIDTHFELHFALKKSEEEVKKTYIQKNFKVFMEPGIEENQVYKEAYKEPYR